MNLIEQILTNHDSEVPYHKAEGYFNGFVYAGRDEGNGQWYGVGANISPHPDKAALDAMNARFLPMDFFGKEIDGPGMLAAIDADFMLLVHLPGYPPEQAQGALMRMVEESGGDQYMLHLLVYQDRATSAKDICTDNQGYFSRCSGQNMPITHIKDWVFNITYKEVHATPALMKQIFSLYPEGPDVNFDGTIWTDGLRYLDYFRTPNVPEGFLNEPPYGVRVLPQDIFFQS